MKTLGFVTSSDDPILTYDERLAFPALEAAGFRIVPVVWDSLGIGHQIPTVDAFVFRSCWNYHQNFAEFQNFLNALERSGRLVFNSLEVIRWNLNKKHILELD